MCRSLQKGAKLAKKNFSVTPDLFSLKFGFSKKQLRQRRRPVPLTNVEMGD